MAFPVRDSYLLINGLSGAVRLVTRETAQKFFNGDMTTELKPFFTHSTSEEEREKAKSLCEFLMKNAVQCTESTIAVTYECNLGCPYCLEIFVKHPETMKMVMDKYKADKVFDALKILDKECTSKNSIVLSGGEPLMKKNQEIVEYILKKGNDLGYSFCVFTNGVELNHFLSSLSSAEVTYLQITLDGPRHLHDRRRILKGGKGTFDQIVENIEKARERGISVLIRTNSDPEILSEIDELARFYRERKWITDPSMRFLLAYACDQHINPERFEQQMEVCEELMKVARRPETRFFETNILGKLHPLFDKSPRFWPAFWNCDAVTRKYAFDPFGDVYSCPTMSGWKEQSIGTYIPELTFNEKHAQWRDRTLFALDKCADCEIRLVCAGGCGYASLLNHGNLFSPLCTTSKRIVIDYLEFLYERVNDSRKEWSL